MPWDPKQYHKFQHERSAPFDDLIALVSLNPGQTVVDLGCGTGELTSRLADYLPGCDVLGIDNSSEMMALAALHGRPGLRFQLGSIESISGEWDLIFSNAALHWVQDHLTLMPRLMAMLRPSGQLAVQVPSNHNHPSHRLIQQIAGETPFREALNGYSRESPVLTIDGYAQCLHDAGGEDITVYEKVYPHVLEDADSVAEWTTGTTLVPYLERLSESFKDRFQHEYRRRLRSIWPESPVFYGFRRTLFAAKAPAT
jgi:trans-aconitate 2-methyltransferase